jgi:uncharacterized protein YcgL (UPF0745 family)
MTYLYLPEEDDMTRVPEALMNLISPVERVLEFELTPERRLAQEDANEVLKQIKEQGWFLQMPRQEQPEFLS